MDERDTPAVNRRLWRGYRTGWNIAFGVVAGVGLGAAVSVLEFGALFGLFFAVALPTGISVAAWSTVSLMRADLPVAVALWAGLLAVITHGMVSLFGPWSLFALVALGLGCPALWTGIRTRPALRRRPRKAGAAPPTAAESAVIGLGFDNPRATRLLDPQCPPGKRPDVAALTISDLGRIWKVSGSWLDRGLNAAETGHLAALRATCLDEIEHRDPRGFSRWVTAEHPWVQETQDVGHPEEGEPPPEGAGSS